MLCNIISWCITLWYVILCYVMLCYVIFAAVWIVAGCTLFLAGTKFPKSFAGLLEFSSLEKLQ